MQLHAEGIEKRFFRKTGSANNFFAVSKTDFDLLPGAVTVLVGRSGSGKTTLLQMLSGLLSPTSGKVFADGTDLYSLPDKALSRFRSTHLAVIPQGLSLLQNLTVMENLLLPGSLYSKSPVTEGTALEMLEKLGIGHLAGVYPTELSGGESRRVAISRALLHRPDVLFADEPTGDLDDENTDLVLDLLQAEARRGAAVLLVTHEAGAERIADNVYRMTAGKLSCERSAHEA
ncbi:MAG: ABC transporter ATP-binding protein [Clostridia bacterium]|nr:ABC transporter ATP-binding protein [Clostridia bacterium]